MVKIIDYLRMYTWDKQIESAVKSGVLSGEEATHRAEPGEVRAKVQARDAKVLPRRAGCPFARKL